LSSEQDHCLPGEASCFGSLPVNHETTIAPAFLFGPQARGALSLRRLGEQALAS